MDRRHSLPAFGALLLAAAAFGAHLGRTAIEEIDPLYFQGAAVHPRDRGAAVDEAMLQPRGPRFADHYGWEEGAAAREDDCFDCDALGARDVYAAGGGAQLAAIETRWRSEPEPALEYVEAGPDPGHEAEPAGFIVEWAEADRYAGYPVEAKPEPEQPVEVAALEE